MKLISNDLNIQSIKNLLIKKTDQHESASRNNNYEQHYNSSTTVATLRRNSNLDDHYLSSEVQALDSFARRHCMSQLSISNPGRQPMDKVRRQAMDKTLIRIRDIDMDKFIMGGMEIS